MHNSNVGGRDFSDAMVDHSVSLGPRDAAGRQDLVVLVHAQWFPTQVLYGQRLTEAQSRSKISILDSCFQIVFFVFFLNFVSGQLTCQSFF